MIKDDKYSGYSTWVELPAGIRIPVLIIKHDLSITYCLLSTFQYWDLPVNILWTALSTLQFFTTLAAIFLVPWSLTWDQWSIRMFCRQQRTTVAKCSHLQPIVNTRPGWLLFSEVNKDYKVHSKDNSTKSFSSIDTKYNGASSCSRQRCTILIHFRFANLLLMDSRVHT